MIDKPKYVTCHACDGAGHLWDWDYDEDAEEEVMVTCHQCDGHGDVPDYG